MYSAIICCAIFFLAVLSLSNSSDDALPANSTLPSTHPNTGEEKSARNQDIVTVIPLRLDQLDKNGTNSSNTTRVNETSVVSDPTRIKGDSSTIQNLTNKINPNISDSKQIPLNKAPTELEILPNSRKSETDVERATASEIKKNATEVTASGGNVKQEEDIKELTRTLAKATQRAAENPEKTAPSQPASEKTADPVRPEITKVPKNDSKHMDSISVKLIRAEDDRIVVEDVALSSTRVFLNETKLKAYSVDYHYTHRLVYFTAFGRIFREEVVGRLAMTGPPQPVATSSTEGSQSLAVDWVHDRLYWMSHRYHTVEGADLDGANRTTLVDTLSGTAFPNNLAVDPYSRFLFMVSNGSIYRSGLDGSEMIQLPVQGVRCLTLDLEGRRILYSGKRGDYSRGKVFLAACDYQGDLCQDLSLMGRWNDIFSLDYFRNTLYFAHYSGGGVEDNVWSADLSKKPLEPTLRGGSQGIWGVRVYHPQKQQKPTSRQTA